MLRIKGSTLTPEEVAAVYAVITPLAAQQPDDREKRRSRRFSLRRRVSTWNPESAAHWRTQAGND